MLNEEKTDKCKDCKFYEHFKVGKMGADRGICKKGSKGYFVYGNSKPCKSFDRGEYRMKGEK